MAKFDSEDRGVRGYFLTEDGEFRLRKLHAHMLFLSQLAEPRTDEEEDGPEIDAAALAGCLELLAEQVQQVIDTVSWPARMEAKRKPASANDGRDCIATGSDAGKAAEPAAMGPPDVGAANVDYVFGMTLDQMDELNRLTDMLAAQGNLLTAGSASNLAEGTVTVVGASIFEGATAVHDIVRQIGSQHPGTRDGWKVREMPAVYDVAIGGRVGLIARLH